MKKIILLSLFVLGISVKSQDKIIMYKAEYVVNDIAPIYHPLLNANPSARPIISHFIEDDALNNNHNMGVAYSPDFNTWILYTEDGAPFVQNSAYFIYVPEEAYSYVHESTVDNNSTFFTYTNNPLTNSDEDKLVFVTHLNRFATDKVDYNLGMFFDVGIGVWNIFNESFTTLPIPRSYHVATSGEEGLLGYKHIMNDLNTIDNYTALDHPLLNGNPNAKFVFTHDGTFHSGVNFLDMTVGAYYFEAYERWLIYSEDESEMFPTTQGAFNILILESSMNTQENQFENSLTAYPNPVVDKVNFNSESIIQKISIYDLSGKMISEMISNSHKVEMNLSQLNPGIYIAKLQTPNGIQTIKLIKK